MKSRREIMQTFRNKNFIKRDPDCINIVFCKSENAPNNNWEKIEDTFVFPAGIVKLKTETENNTTIIYYGYFI